MILVNNLSFYNGGVTRPVHGRSPVLVNATRLLRGTSVWPSRAPGGTLVHSASAIAIATLDAVVRGVGPAVSH
jgi:hypothetical protein